MLPIIKFTGELPERLRGRSQLSDEKVRESVKSIIAGVRERGDAALIDYTEWSMRVYLPMLLIYGIQVACQYSFVALDQAPKAIFLTVWRKIILLIPLIFFLPHIWPDAVTGVYLAEPIADTIAICTTAPMFYAYYRKLK